MQKRQLYREYLREASLGELRRFAFGSPHYVNRSLQSPPNLQCLHAKQRRCGRVRERLFVLIRLLSLVLEWACPTESPTCRPQCQRLQGDEVGLLSGV